MKKLSCLTFLAGVATLAFAIIGRFKGAPTIYLFGEIYGPKTFIHLANSILLIAVFLHLASRSDDR